MLDVLGMIPGVGFVFDGINAAWYASEGDWFNAATSFVSMLPGLGDAVGALAKGGKACKIVTAFHKASAAGNLILGAYTLGNVAEKYISGDASFTWDEIKGDLFTVAMTGASMLGSAKDFGTSYCFVAGTLVTTADGFKPIEEIQVGDKVLSENERTGEIAYKEVYATSVSETNEFFHIHVNDEEIVATGTHPFYVHKFGWTTARALRAGDVLVLSNGELVTVEWIEHEILEEPIFVYNFEVEDFHTYFVGMSGILVHNGKPCETKNISIDKNRKEAMNEAKDLAGVPRSQQPSRQWQVGGDINKKGLNLSNYEYSSNPGSFGRYYEYDTPKGKRVVVEHINDQQPNHFHVGEPKDKDRLLTYDFKKERYQKVINPTTNDHHIYYKK